MRIPRGLGVDPAQPPVLLQQGQGQLQVDSLAEADAGGLMGVAAAELHLTGPADPVQQPAGVVDPWVGTHQIEGGAGVVDQVAGQAGGAGEGVAVDRPGPAVTQIPRQVQQAGEAAGGAGELGRPASQVGQVAGVGGQPRL